MIYGKYNYDAQYTDYSTCRICCYMQQAYNMQQLKYMITVLQCSRLIPELDQSIPTSCCYFRRFMRVPQSTDADGVMCLELAVQLLCLPIPDKQLPISIARNQIAVMTFTTK